MENALLGAGVLFVKNESLANHSTFRIGGTCDYAIYPKNEAQLALTVRLLKENGIPFLVIGKGSNVVFSDQGVRGAVIFTEKLHELERAGDVLSVGAGISLSKVATFACENGLSGAEFLYGIPGSLGGAVFMNAGAFGGSLSDICGESVYYDAETDTVKCFCGREQGFGNRESVYQSHPEYIILRAKLKLTPKNAEEIRKTMDEYAAKRKSTQPLEFPSAGSVFKRPAGSFAGKLIEDCGLKGLTVGGAEVSVKHAGFIVNRGGATCEDVKRLMDSVREKVQKETNIALEPEIRFL